MKKLLISLLAIFFVSFALLAGASAASPAGDVNGDGEVNVRDSASILLYVNGKPVELVADAADVNGDGVIDASDADYILKYITKHPDVKLESGSTCSHSLKKTDGFPATYDSEGLIDHWTCEKCGLIFKDAQAKTLTTSAGTVIPVKILEASEGLEFKLSADGKSYSVVGIGTCAKKDIVIPSTHLGLPVTEIGVCAFESTEIVSVYIPSSVKTIKRAAFNYCEYLETITLSEGLLTVKEDAFADTPIKSIRFPKTVESIDAFVFNCPYLESIEVAEGNPYYFSAGNCLIEKATKTLVAGCLNSVIPADGSVTVIGDGAFYGQYDLQSIVIPDGVTKIGSYAFSPCMSLSSINIPEGVVELGDGALIGCSGIESITLPSTLKKIGDTALGALYELREIVIPAGVTEIIGNPFYECYNLESIKVEAGNTVYHAAGNCLIETATKTLISGCYTSVIPDDGSVTVIGYEAFASLDNLTEIIIPNCIEEISDRAFAGSHCLETFIFLGTEEEWNSITKGDDWNESCPFTEVSFVTEHIHSIVTVLGTPAGERSFGIADYVYCSTCSEVFSEATVLLPLGIRNPDYYAGRYSYDYLGTLENGAGMQAFYLALDEVCKQFHTDYTVTTDDQGFLEPVYFYDFGITLEQAETVYMLYRDDHPLYYWIDNKVAYSSTVLYPIVAERYRDGDARAFYNEMVYMKAAEYLLMAERETSPYQIAFLLHDAILINAEYAYVPGTNVPEDSEWAHSIIGIIEKNMGVCESYTEVFSMLLNFLEIENIRVSGLGNGGAHAWSLVKLDDGKWYWYDLTWNDNSWPMYDIIHRHFAVNDSESTSPEIPGWSFQDETFLDRHEPGDKRGFGLEYNIVLPERAATPFSSEDTLIHETFELDAMTYTVIGYDRVYCSTYYGYGTPPPATVTYNGRTYNVVYFEY